MLSATTQSRSPSSFAKILTSICLTALPGFNYFQLYSQLPLNNTNLIILFSGFKPLTGFSYTKAKILTPFLGTLDCCYIYKPLACLTSKMLHPNVLNFFQFLKHEMDALFYLRPSILLHTAENISYLHSKLANASSWLSFKYWLLLGRLLGMPVYPGSSYPSSTPKPSPKPTLISTKDRYSWYMLPQ